MSEDQRSRTVSAVLNAVRTAEAVAAERAAALCSDEVMLVVSGESSRGIGAVRRHLAMQWPLTPVYRRGAWSLPAPAVGDDETVQVTGTFAGTGAAPRSATIAVSFDGDDRATRISLSTDGGPRPEPARQLSPEVRAAINNALANGTPVIVGYVDEDGKPKLSPRGSTQCLSGTQLCIWARPASSGGLVASIQRRPAISLLYRDSRDRSTLIVEGRAKIVEDAEIRDTVFGLSPEVEQNHDPDMKGTAVVIDIDKVTGSLPSGPVSVEPGN